MSLRVSHLRKATGYTMPRRCTVSTHHLNREYVIIQAAVSASQRDNTLPNKCGYIYTSVARCSMGTVCALQGGVRHAIMWQLYFFILMNTIATHTSNSNVHLFCASGKQSASSTASH